MTDMTDLRKETSRFLTVESIQIKYIHEWETWAVCYLDASGDYAWDAEKFTTIDPDFFYLRRHAIAHAKSAQESIVLKKQSALRTHMVDVPITIERKDAFIN